VRSVIIPRSIADWPWRIYERFEPISAEIVQTESGESLIQVCSTQYLGMPWQEQAAREISAAASSAPPSYWGSLGSNYLGGTHEERLRFESCVASVCCCEDGRAFVSGWAANYAIGEALSKICDVIVSDSRNHNSIIHGLRAGRANVIVADLRAESVGSVLKNNSWSRIGVIAPSLEGLTGESVVPVIEDDLRERAVFVLDECHSFGALGETGFERFEGLCPDVRIAGFSKAFGTMGSVVCGSKSFLEVFSQLASPWIFSTAVPPVIWKMNRALVPIVASMAEERKKILSLAEGFRKGLVSAGLRHSGKHHITGVHIPSGFDVGSVEAEIRREGFLIKVSQYPSRPKDDPCARFAFTPMHNQDSVDRLVEVVLRVLRGYGCGVVGDG
jgi:7-keto-8-aminopelargonate synthetase-like enzyme